MRSAGVFSEASKRRVETLPTGDDFWRASFECRSYMAWGEAQERRAENGESAFVAPFPVVLRAEVGMRLFKWAVS